MEKEKNSNLNAEKSLYDAHDVTVTEAAGSYEEETDDDEMNNTYLWISLAVFLTWILSFLIQ